MSGELPEERWLPTQTVTTILLSIISLLSAPNTSSPANVDASVRSTLPIPFTHFTHPLHSSTPFIHTSLHSHAPPPPTLTLLPFTHPPPPSPYSHFPRLLLYSSPFNCASPPVSKSLILAHHLHITRTNFPQHPFVPLLIIHYVRKHAKNIFIISSRLLLLLIIRA